MVELLKYLTQTGWHFMLDVLLFNPDPPDMQSKSSQCVIKCDIQEVLQIRGRSYLSDDCIEGFQLCCPAPSFIEKSCVHQCNSCLAGESEHDFLFCI